MPVSIPTGEDLILNRKRLIETLRNGKSKTNRYRITIVKYYSHSRFVFADTRLKTVVIMYYKDVRANRVCIAIAKRNISEVIKLAIKSSEHYLTPSCKDDHVTKAFYKALLCGVDL